MFVVQARQAPRNRKVANVVEALRWRLSLCDPVDEPCKVLPTTHLPLAWGRGGAGRGSVVVTEPVTTFAVLNPVSDSMYNKFNSRLRARHRVPI